MHGMTMVDKRKGTTRSASRIFLTVNASVVIHEISRLTKITHRKLEIGVEVKSKRQVPPLMRYSFVSEFREHNPIGNTYSTTIEKSTGLCDKISIIHLQQSSTHSHLCNFAPGGSLPNLSRIFPEASRL